MSKRKTLLYGIMGLLCIAFAKVSKAQVARLQQGIIYKQGSSVRLGSVKVRNKRTGITVRSDMYGVYAVRAEAGDSLELSGAGYSDGQVVVNDFLTKVSYLIPAAELPEVEIKGNALLADL